MEGNWNETKFKIFSIKNLPNISLDLWTLREIGFICDPMTTENETVKLVTNPAINLDIK